MSSSTMTTHQKWSCDVILATNFENFYFSPDFILNFGKSYQVWEKLAQEQKGYRQKTKLGVENTPPPPPPPVLIELSGNLLVDAALRYYFSFKLIYLLLQFSSEKSVLELG